MNPIPRKGNRRILRMKLLAQICWRSWRSKRCAQAPAFQVQCLPSPLNLELSSMLLNLLGFLVHTNFSFFVSACLEGKNFLEASSASSHFTHGALSSMHPQADCAWASSGPWNFESLKQNKQKPSFFPFCSKSKCRRANHAHIAHSWLYVIILSNRYLPWASLT